MVKRLVENLLHKELSYQIHGAAIEVRKDFGPGHKEKLYQNAFAEELKRRKIPFEKEKAIKIYSPKDGKYIGLYRPDFIVDQKVIIEIKAERFVNRDEIKRIYDYLRNSEYELAYFINFASPKLFVKRIIYSNDRKPFHNPLKDTNTELNNTKKLLVSISLILVFFSGVQAANAATLYFSPASGFYSVGEQFSVGVYISSPDQAMNAASARVLFPADKLEVVSLNKTSSIVSLWVQEPTFSNTEGQANFEGIVLNPGFTGVSGKIITINFRVKAGGNAALAFFSGSVLANDGQGTNILTGFNSAQFSLAGAAPSIPTSTPTVIAGAPQAPQISSPTNPDQNQWYNNPNPKFIWVLPKDINVVRLLYNKNADSRPVITYEPPITEKELENIQDGVYYFHAQFRNKNGWGSISHFRFQTDTQPPEPFEIIFIDGDETTNPRPTVVFETTDSLAGIDHYRLKIGEGEFFIVSGDQIIKANPYTLPLQKPGKRTILIQAYDKAGNYRAVVKDFTIVPLNTPKITKYPKKLESDGILTVEGETYPSSKVEFWLQRENEPPKMSVLNSDENGKFIFLVDEKLKDGIYKIWAEVVDEREARSLPTEKLTINVAGPAILRIGSQAISLLAIAVSLVALIFLLLSLLWRIWHKFKLFKNKLRKETSEAEKIVHKAFDILKEDIREQIKMLEKTRTKRQLTEEEEKIITQLKKDLSKAEETIQKEIGEIGKE